MAPPPPAGQVYFYEPPTMQQLETLDVDLACQHFAAAFRNPAEFTLCFTGAFEVSSSPLHWLLHPGCSLLGSVWCCRCVFTDCREDSVLHGCLGAEDSSCPLTSSVCSVWPHLEA